jgi:acid phosphatase (class A)
MTRRSVGLLLACAVLPLAMTAEGFAQAPAAKPAAAKPKFLTAADYISDELLPAPPKDGSPKALAELAEVRALEHSRSPAELDRARQDEKIQNTTIFVEVMGPAFDLTKLPATAQLLADVQVEEKAAAKAAKDHFLRNRPWIIDPAVQSCAKDDAPRSSYPSGHATFGFSQAVILAKLEPAKAPALMARAAEYADNRLVCGMHFRSDVVAGQALGTAVALKLLMIPAFREEFDAAAQELAKAGV